MGKTAEAILSLRQKDIQQNHYAESILKKRGKMCSPGIPTLRDRAQHQSRMKREQSAVWSAQLTGKVAVESRHEDMHPNRFHALDGAHLLQPVHLYT
jgi:hypothetical protein